MADAHPLEFQIKPKVGAAILTFLYSQLFVTPRYPTTSFSGKTVIVTGSNGGLGLEAAKHFYRLGAAKLVLAVRNVSKGEAAKEDILQSTTRTDPNTIEIWSLDQSSNQSTSAFADRVLKELPRLDVLVLNAGITAKTFALADGYEQVTQVNVLNTFLLAFSILPKLFQTKAHFPESTPHLTVVSSEAHHLNEFKEINAPDVYAKLNEEQDYAKQSRYEVTKLLEILLTRELVARLRSSPKFQANPVIINITNPGLCYSGLGRDNTQPSLMNRLIYRMIGRTTEVGGRCLVLAAAAPENSHGEFQSDGENQDVEGWIYTDMGMRVQKKAWQQTIAILEDRRPDILAAAGLQDK